MIIKVGLQSFNLMNNLLNIIQIYINCKKVNTKYFDTAVDLKDKNMECYLRLIKEFS